MKRATFAMAVALVLTYAAPADAVPPREGLYYAITLVEGIGQVDGFLYLVGDPTLETGTWYYFNDLVGVLAGQWRVDVDAGEVGCVWSASGGFDPFLFTGQGYYLNMDDGPFLLGQGIGPFNSEALVFAIAL